MTIPYDVTRFDWKALPAVRQMTPVKDLSVYKGVELHHNGTPTRNGWKIYPNIQRAQMNSGKYADIFYHVGLPEDGKIWELRGWEWRNVSRLVWLAGRKRLVVNFTGNMETDRPTVAQEEGFRKIREALRDAGGGTEVFYHGDRANTLCPGQWVRKMNLLPLRPKVDSKVIVEVPAIGFFKSGRYPLWVVRADGFVTYKNGAPLVKQLSAFGVDRLDAPIVRAFWDHESQLLVMIADDQGTFALPLVD